MWKSEGVAQLWLDTFMSELDMFSHCYQNTDYVSCVDLMHFAPFPRILQFIFQLDLADVVMSPHV